MRLDTEREVAQNLRPQPVAQANVLESDHPPSDKFAIGRRICPAVVLAHVETRPLPHTCPELCCFFTGLWRACHSRRTESYNSSHVSRGCHGFRSINGRLVPWHPTNIQRPHAYRLPELFNVVRNRIGLAGRGGPYGSLRPLQSTWFANGSQPAPEMAIAGDQNEAEGAFTGVHSRRTNEQTKAVKSRICRPKSTTQAR